MARFKMGFVAALPIVFVAVALTSLALECTLYRPLYESPHLDQVLPTVGIICVAVAGATYFWGSGRQPVAVPTWITGQLSVAGLELSRYRLFLTMVGAIVALLLVFGLERTWSRTSACGAVCRARFRSTPWSRN